jgi:hypothetical protein
MAQQNFFLKIELEIEISKNRKKLCNRIIKTPSQSHEAILLDIKDNFQ